MNSSVTLDSAISVMSSLCLEISASSRSNGPSNTSRGTSNPPPARISLGSSVIVAVIQEPDPVLPSLQTLHPDIHPAIIVRPGSPTRPPSGRPRLRREPAPASPLLRGFLAQPLGDQALLARGIQVGQQHGQRLADDPAPVHGNAESPQREPGTLQVEQFAAGQVDGDLLGVALPAAGQTLGFGDRAPARGPEQFRDSGQA